MDIDKLREDLEAFGTVVKCQYGNIAEDYFGIVIDSFNGDLDGYNVVINDQLAPYYPYLDHLSVSSEGRLKAQYDKAETRSS